MTLPARFVSTPGRADARAPLFRSELLTVRDLAAVERCGTRHQLAFAQLGDAPRHLRLDDAPPRDPTCVIVVPAGEAPPSRRATDGAAWTVLGFARGVPLAGGGAWPLRTVVATATPLTLLRLHALRAELDRPCAGDVEPAAVALLADVLPGAGDETRGDAPGARRRRAIVDGARRIVARAPGQPHPLAEVARALGISSSHLAHVFRAESGMPLHRWLLHLRLAVALEQLARGDGHLSALALDLGFATHSHFSAAFRQWCGMTPAAARALLVRPPSAVPRRDASA